MLDNKMAKTRKTNKTKQKQSNKYQSVGRCQKKKQLLAKISINFVPAYDVRDLYSRRNCTSPNTVKLAYKRSHI